MKHSHLLKSVLLCICLLFALSSCSGVIGYSVVLWTIGEEGIADGTIVPVYLKSNISHVYVISAPDSSEKIEVPLWKISTPVSKSKALVQAQKYQDYAHQYAKCVLDGLPVRTDPENGSKQVYRLRQDEIIRVLYKGQGVIPTNGKELLAGEWLRVLASDGTTGWCFSQNLRLFTMNADGSYGEGAVEANVQEADNTLETFLSSKWYPDYYAQMINRKQVDQRYVNPSFGFDTGSATGEVHLRLFNLDVTYPYAGLTRLRGGVYRYNNTSLQVTIKSASSIVVQYTDNSGKPKSYGFITLPAATDITQVLADEVERRTEEVASLVNMGPEFSSTNYGTLMFGFNGVFSWQDYDLLVPSVINQNAQPSGTVRVQYFISSALKKEWDGVLTFMFDGMEDEVNLLYKKASNGLRLSVAHIAENEDTLSGRTSFTVLQAKNSPVMFFVKSGE